MCILKIYGYGDPMDDSDSEGNGKLKGDGFTRYEEYRGVMINNLHERLKPEWKEAFIMNESGAMLHIYMFSTNFRIIEINKNKDEEFYNKDIKIINFNSYNFETKKVKVYVSPSLQFKRFPETEVAVNIRKATKFTIVPQHG